MTLLLDTHIALWAIGHARLPPEARWRIEATETVSVSAISVWEIAIKYALRRGRRYDIAIAGRDARDEFVRAGFELLPVSVEHACAVDDLPLLHGDPIDRLLIAQARVERFTLLTADRTLEGYGDPVALN